MIAINGGRHVNPLFAGDTLYAWSEVLAKEDLGDNAGYITPDDRWDNYWRAGPNALLGWSPSLPGSGQGAAI